MISKIDGGSRVGLVGGIEQAQAVTGTSPAQAGLSPEYVRGLSAAANISVANAVAYILLNGEDPLSLAFKAAPPAERELLVGMLTSTLEGQSVEAVADSLAMIRNLRS